MVQSPSTQRAPVPSKPVSRLAQGLQVTLVAVRDDISQSDATAVDDAAKLSGGSVLVDQLFFAAGAQLRLREYDVM